MIFWKFLFPEVKYLETDEQAKAMNAFVSILARKVRRRESDLEKN